MYDSAQTVQELCRHRAVKVMEGGGREVSKARQIQERQARKARRGARLRLGDGEMTDTRTLLAGGEERGRE